MDLFNEYISKKIHTHFKRKLLRDSGSFMKETLKENHIKCCGDNC